MCIRDRSASAEEIQKSAQADPRGEVVISNVAGEVRVTGWDRNEVHVSADLSDDNQRLEFRTSGARTTIEVMLPKGRSYHGSTDLVVQVPRTSLMVWSALTVVIVSELLRGMQRLQA